MSSFKLYYTAHSCGAANFITASLAGLTFDSEKVDLMTKKTESGADYFQINPKGSVPAVVTSDGTTLSENVSCLTYIADQAPSAGLAPAAGTKERYPYLDKLAFVNSSLHKAFGILFMPNDDATKEKLRARAVTVAKQFSEIVLKDAKFLGGDKPSAADIYAYIVFTWGDMHGVDLSGNTVVQEFRQRVKEYPGVAEAHAKMNA